MVRKLFEGRTLWGRTLFVRRIRRTLSGDFFFVDATGFGKEENTRVHCAVKYVLVLAERVI